MFSGAEPNPNPIPWIIIYFIGKWLMTRHSQDPNKYDTERIDPNTDKQPPPLPNSRLKHTTFPAEKCTSDNAIKKSPKNRIILAALSIPLLVIGIGYAAYHIYLRRVYTNALENTPKDAYVFFAATSQRFDVLDELLLRGGDPNQRGPSGHTPLIVSVRHNNLKQIERLYMAGADLDQRDDYGWAPIHHAIIKDRANLDAIKLLASYGANINITDKRLRTPLHRAAMFGHTDAANLLIEFGANKKAEDSNGLTPFDRAFFHGKTKDLLE